MNKTSSNSTAVIFAAYSKNGQLYDDVPPYLVELKKYSDFLIYVSDNDTIQADSLDIIKKYSDCVIVQKHNQYDFGSYKIGFNYLINSQKDLYDKLDRIFFCNDSVIYCGKSLDKFFNKSEGKNFYGMTWHAYGFSRQENAGIVSYPWSRLPHIQSYLFSVSKEIADNKIFRDFINNIQIEQCKEDIIAKYEIGLSRLISEVMGYEQESYYPKVDDWFEPCGYFLSQNSSYKEPRLFLKRKPLAPIQLQHDIYVGL